MNIRELSLSILEAHEAEMENEVMLELGWMVESKRQKIVLEAKIGDGDTVNWSLLRHGDIGFGDRFSGYRGMGWLPGNASPMSRVNLCRKLVAQVIERARNEASA